MFLGFVVPEAAPITRTGMEVIFIFLGLIWGWLFCDLLWPSVLGTVVLGISSYFASPEAAWASFFSNGTLLSMIFAFIFFSYISDTGLLDRAMDWLVSRKMFAGKPWAFVSFFLSMVALLALCFAMIVLMLLCFEFMGKLFKRAGITKESLVPSYIFLGIAIFASFGNLLIPYMPNALITLGLITQCLGGTALTFPQWFLVVDLPIIITFALYLLVGRFVFRLDLSAFAVANDEITKENAAKGKTPFTSEQRVAIIALIIFLVCNMVPTMLPSSIAIVAWFKNFGLIGVTGTLLVLLSVYQFKNGTTPINFAKQAAKGVHWTMVFLVGAIMAITSALTNNASTGIITWLATNVVPLVRGFDVFAFVAIVMIFIGILTQFSMNMVLMFAFAPILTSLGAAMGMNPLIPCMAVICATQISFLAPTGSQGAALAYAQSDWLVMKSAQKVAIPWAILSLVAYYLCVVFLVPIAYPI